MTQHPLVSPHDCVGSNLYAHVLRGRVMRIVPRANEAINETWISDRDRFSYQGIYSDGPRCCKPMVRENGAGRRRDWERRSRASPSGSAASRSTRRRSDRRAGVADATLEELLPACAPRARPGLRESRSSPAPQDFRDQASDPLHPSLGCAIAGIRAGERDPRRRLEPAQRSAADRPPHAQGGAARRREVSFVNPQRYEYLFPVAGTCRRTGSTCSSTWRRICRRGGASGTRCRRRSRRCRERAADGCAPRDRAAALRRHARLILLGALAQRASARSRICARCRGACGADRRDARLPARRRERGGRALAGVLPHRAAAASAATAPA